MGRNFFPVPNFKQNKIFPHWGRVWTALFATEQLVILSLGWTGPPIILKVDTTYFSVGFQQGHGLY